MRAGGFFAGPARIAALAVAAAVLSAIARGEDNAPVRLKRPQDFAPPELVVVPRPPAECLPKGSLLATGVGGRRPVNHAELHRRQLAMWAGVRQTDALPGLAGDAPARVAAPVASLTDNRVNLGAVAFWSLVGASVLVTFILLGRVLLSFQRR